MPLVHHRPPPTPHPPISMLQYSVRRMVGVIFTHSTLIWGVRGVGWGLLRPLTIIMYIFTFTTSYSTVFLKSFGVQCLNRICLEHTRINEKPICFIIPVHLLLGNNSYILTSNINKIIDSMGTRLSHIIIPKGGRIEYQTVLILSQQYIFQKNYKKSHTYDFFVYFSCFCHGKIFQVYRSTDFMRYNTLKIQLRQLNDG